MSQSDLARMVGVKQMTVSRWERGQLPRPKRQRAIVDALGVTWDEVFGPKIDLS